MGCLVLLVLGFLSWLVFQLAEKFDSGVLHLVFFILFMTFCGAFGSIVDEPMSKKSKMYKSLTKRNR